MKALVVGKGGREHAIAWALSLSPGIEEVFVAPGNAGTALEKKCKNVSLNSFNEMADFALRKEIDFTVVGPEKPLAEGIVDFFESKGLRVFGPTKNAARIESSKSFCRNLLKKHSLPIPEFNEFTEASKAIDFIKGVDWKNNPLVIKADGLAAGKGVILPANQEEAIKAIDSLMVDKEFGEAGEKILIEERLYGFEVSMLALTDSKEMVFTPPSQDHKRALDGDKGLNTGGMGAYSCKEIVDSGLLEEMSEVMKKTINALNREGIKFKGVLYGGFMIQKERPFLLEYNVRFGDPEIQVILPLLDFDFAKLINACIEERLSEIKNEVKWKNEAACTVVLASKGYPLNYGKGKEITGLKKAGSVPGAKVFHAGTKLEGKKILTDGGRVLNVTAVKPTIREAVNSAYEALKFINFDGMHYRKDIAHKVLGRELNGER